MLSKLQTRVSALLSNKKRGQLIEGIDSGLTGEAPETVNNQPGTILTKQILRLLLFVLGALAMVMVVINIVVAVNSSSKKKGSGNKADLKPEELKIEIASKALDPEKMWRNHFEDKLIESEGKVNDKLSLIDESLKQKEKTIEEKTRADLELMRQQLEFAKNELKEATEELKSFRAELIIGKDKEGSGDEAFTDYGNIASYLVDNDRDIARPKSSRSFIPETAYVSGILLGGISVSTGAFSSSEPTPVIIRITDRGNLPRNFEVDLRKCRILGSSYGDLSSERAIIRAEVMSCQDLENEQVITTKIAGMAFGDDGVNGVKGRVVQTSTRQLQHAFLGGILSGFAGAAKSGEQFTFTGAGAINTKQPPFKDRLKDSTLGGMGTAGEKIADYYLRQAENMSPVLQIPAGSRVDVVFTKGVYLGSMNVRRSIEQDRRVSSSKQDSTGNNTSSGSSNYRGE